MRAAIARIEPGEYRFEDVMDDDGLGTRDIPLRLRIVVPADAHSPRCSSTSPAQARRCRGNINGTITVTQAAVLLFAQSSARPGGAEQSGPDRTSSRSSRRSARCQF